MALSLPNELLEQIERGNVLLFLGDSLAQSAEGQSLYTQIASILAARLQLTAKTTNFAHMAQRYVNKHGRQALIQQLRDQLELYGEAPQAVHRLIAGLSQCATLVTTAPDRQLECAFAEVNRPLLPIIRTSDVPFEEQSRAQLYKLRGSIEQADSLILTEEEYESFFDDQESISIRLQSLLMSKTILFLGYDLSDAGFRRMYRKVMRPLDDFARRPYAAATLFSEETVEWCEQKRIQLIHAEPSELLEAITKQLSTRARPLSMTPHRPASSQAILPQKPYKLLDYYEAQDAALFFGRQQETQELSTLIHAHRLTLVYGASGVGKTSLLLAGVAPLLEQQDPPYLALYARALDDPAQVIRRALQTAHPELDLNESVPLLQALWMCNKSTGKRIVIFLDQFEEFFIRLSPQYRAAFIRELATIHETAGLPVRIVLSLREEWLSNIDELEQRLPDVRRNRMRILPLRREQAAQAITEPAALLGIRYEPALVERLLDDLLGTGGESVLPPQLQLVCSRLYEQCPSDSHILSLAQYDGLGGARGILRQYLDDELTLLSAAEQGLARALLAELVTSQGTKAVKNLDDLGRALGIDPPFQALHSVIDKLVHARLLRPVASEQATGYELAHEYLISEIDIDAETQKRKQIEELILQEVDNRQRFGDTLLGSDKLAKINEQRELLRLSPEAQELILRSALDIGYEPDYWLSRIDDPAQRLSILRDSADSPVSIVRQRVAAILGSQDIPETAEILLEMALRDGDVGVRRNAQRSLRQIAVQHPEIVEQLRKATQQRNNTERRNAWEALAVLPLNTIPGKMKPRIIATRSRVNAAHIARQSTTTPQGRAILAVFGIVLLILAGLYTWAWNSYTIATAISPIVDDKVPVIIVRRGLGWVDLPGVNEVLIETGISLGETDAEGQKLIQESKLSGLWSTTDPEDGYQQWANDLAGTLKPETRIPFLWYIAPSDEIGVERIFNPKSSYRSVEVQLAYQKAVLDWMPYLLKVKPQFASEALQFVTPMIMSPDLEVQRSVADKLGEIAYASRSIAPQVINMLNPFLHSKDSKVQSSALNALSQAITSNSELASTVLTLVIPMLRSPDSAVQRSAANVLGQTVTSNPKLASQIVLLTTPLLNSQDTAVQSSATDALTQAVSSNPELASQVVALVSPLMDSPDNWVQSRVVKLLGQAVISNPGLVPQIMALTTPLLSNQDILVQSSAVNLLSQVVMNRPELAPQVVELIIPLLSNQSIQVQQSAAGILGQVVTSNPEFAPQVLAVITPLLSSQDVHLQSGAIDALSQIVTSNPEFVPQVLSIVKPFLNSQDTDIQSNAVNVLGQAVISNPKSIPQIIELLMPLLSSQDSWLKSRITEILGNAALLDKRLAPKIMELLIPLLSDTKNSILQVNAVTALGKVAVADPSLATHIVALLTSFLRIDTAVYPRTQMPWLKIGDMEYRVVSALGQSYSGLVENNTYTLDDIVSLLIDSRDQFERVAAAQAIFHLALEHPDKIEEFRRHIRQQIKKPEPVGRMWSNIALEMLDIASHAHMCLHDEPSNVMMCSSYETFASYDSLLFQEQSGWAFKEAQSWLESKRGNKK